MSLTPDEKGVESSANARSKMTARAYPLFDICRD